MRLLFSLLLLFAAGTATADDFTGYLGGALGRMDFDASYIGEPSLHHEKIDSNAGVLGLYGGLEFSRYWGLELFERNSRGMSSDSNYHDASLQQIAVMPTLKWEINPLLTLFFQAGLTSADYTMTLKAAPYSNDNYQWFGTGYILQTSANIGLGENLKLRIGYDYSSMKLQDPNIAYINFWKSDPPEMYTSWTSSSLGLHYRY